MTFTGTVSSPALSPDGEAIAYWSHEGPLSDSGQLMVQDLSGGDPVLFQNSAERESVSLHGFGWPQPRHSRSTWGVLDPVLFQNSA